MEFCTGDYGKVGTDIAREQDSPCFWADIRNIADGFKRVTARYKTPRDQRAEPSLGAAAKRLIDIDTKLLEDKDEEIRKLKAEVKALQPEKDTVNQAWIDSAKEIRKLKSEAKPLMARGQDVKRAEVNQEGRVWVRA